MTAVRPGFEPSSSIIKLWITGLLGYSLSLSYHQHVVTRKHGNYRVEDRAIAEVYRI
jgi:hypothetical protein